MELVRFEIDLLLSGDINQETLKAKLNELIKTELQGVSGEVISSKTLYKNGTIYNEPQPQIPYIGKRKENPFSPFDTQVTYESAPGRYNTQSKGPNYDEREAKQ